MADFYAARSGTIPPLPWSNFAPPLSIAGIAAANPSYSELDATKHFVLQKYGDWIDANMPHAQHEYLIDVPCTEWFDVDFTYQDDAEEFRTKIGGNYL